MAFPNFKGKHAHDSMIDPSEFKRYSQKIGKWPSYPAPKGVIFCYDRELMKHVIDNHKTEQKEGFYGDFRFLSETKGKVALLGNFGIGAPIAGTLLEELISFGVKRFISIGTAGTLQRDLGIGDIVVCDSAIRDEGTSHHYAKPSKFAYASKQLTAKIKSALNQKGIQYASGTSWTIDAPYRETVAEARRYQHEGILTVEMEASALFAIAEYRKIQIGSIFTISDSLAELKWKPDFESKQLRKGLETLYRVAIDVLQ